MDIKNLSRAAEINTYLPAIDEARKAISGGKASVRIVTQAGKVISLPENLNYNVIHVLNCEYAMASAAWCLKTIFRNLKHD